MIRSRLVRTTRAVVLGLALLTTITACGMAAADPDEVGVAKKGAMLLTPFENPEIQEKCLLPQENRRIGFGDEDFRYPAGLRTFTFGEPTENFKPEYPPIEVVVDNITMRFGGVLSFNLVGPQANSAQPAGMSDKAWEKQQESACEILKRFHQQIGSKDWEGNPAYNDEGGWAPLNGTHLGGPLRNGLVDAAGRPIPGGKTVKGQPVAYTFLDFYNSPEARLALQNATLKSLPERVKNLAKGAYWQNFALELFKPTVGGDTVKALESVENARLENKAQAERNATALTAIDQIKACKKQGQSEATCAFLYAINSDKVPYVVPPGGSATIQGQPAAPAPAK